MRVIGFDPSKTNTGFAIFDGRSWLTGGLRCPVKRPADAPALDARYTGEVMEWFGFEVGKLLDTHKPDFAGIEQPLNTNAGGMSGQMPIQTVHLLHGIAAELCAICHAYEVPAEYVPMQTWRRAFGVKAKGTDALKKAALQICRFEKIPVATADAAEAVGVARWLWSERTGTRFSRHGDAPLFAGRAA